MCGIAGIFNRDGAPVRQEAIDRFTDSLSHRGPDGRGVWSDERCGIALGHRRLSILDLSEDGKQPMSYAHGRYWITFNGEIYNFLELRDLLEQKGCVFHSQTDTEVILAAYNLWGPDMLSKFNGMWAFAIFDSQEQSLFIARDRFGIKPFLFYQSDKQFAFASELKAFRALEGFACEIDYDCAARFLAEPFAVEGSRRTLFKGVQRLQAGHCGYVKPGSASIWRWWNTSDHLVSVPRTLDEQAERFHELFLDSIRIRLRSDVPIGTCLSGGFDSTSVACSMLEACKTGGTVRASRDWQHAFVATFPGAANDERPQAIAAASFAGLQAHLLEIDEKCALPEIDGVLDDLDDLFIGLPTAVWMIYRQLRRHRVVVSLDGHGADELMGAYKQADYTLLNEAPSWFRAPMRNVQLLREYCALMPQKSLPKGFLARAAHLASVELANHPDLGWLHRGARGLRRFWRENITRSAPGFLALRPPPGNADYQCLGATDPLPGHWGRANRELYTMFHCTALPTILRNFDRLSMAHGIEVRMPFMDWRLVTYVMSLPDASKLGAGQTKRVARLAMRARIPEEIRTSRLKIGFGSPMPEWLNGPLKGWVESVLNRAPKGGHPIIDVPRVRKFVEHHTQRQSWSWLNCGAAWPYIHLLWFEQNFVKC